MRKNRSVRILALLCALLLLCGCGAAAQPESTEPVRPETSEPSAPTEAPAESGPFSADYELAWQALEEDYPYLDYLRGKGVNVDMIRERFAEQVKDIRDVDDFARLLDRVFKGLGNTAHLDLVSRPFFALMYNSYVLNPDPFHAPWADTMREAAQAGYYAVPDETNSEEYDGLDHRPPVGVMYYKEYRTLCITMEIFLDTLVERDRDVIWQAVARYPEAEHIVFDITRNSGGSDRYWMQNIVAPFGDDYSVDARLYFKDSPRNRLILDGLTESCPIAEAENPAPWAEQYGLDRYFTMTMEVEGQPKVQSDAKRWVLVSGVVYSASEQFTQFCKATGWATVIGKQTGGDGIGFDPILVLLPDSGLLFRFSNTAGETADGRMSIEGTTPDVELQAAGIKYFLRYISEQQDN